MNSTINLIDSVTSLDWIVFALVFIITFASVIYGNRLKHTSSEKDSLLDHLIMGRMLTMPLFIATLVATWYGGIFGVTELAFQKGIYNFVTQGFFWYIAYIIFALFLIDKIATYKAITLPDMINKMFGPKSAKLAAYFNFFNVLPIAYTMSLGLFLQTLTGWNFIACMVIGQFVVILYSIFGGFRAVVFSDLIQFVVMCLAVLLVLVFSYFEFGGVTFLKANLEPRYFTLTGGNSLATTFVWGLIALSTLVDPNFYQRVFAANSKKTAKKGILISTLIWLCFDICTTLGAMYAKAIIPDAAANTAYLTYAVQLLPAGLKGFLLAGILATILSTLDSYLFLAGTTISYDILPKRLKGKISIHHLSIVFVSILSIVLAVVFDGSVKTVWKTLGSYSASCLLFPVLFGHIFPKRIKDMEFVFICLFGVIVVTIWRNIEKVGFWANVDEIYLGVAATSLGLLVSSLKNRSLK